MRRFSQQVRMLAVIGMGVMLQTVSASAATTTQSCMEVVDSLQKEWKVVDFSTPSKPTAVRVEGKYGHENTAAQISYMQDQIKKADADCKAGNQQSALERVASVHDLLDSHGVSEETANAAMAQQ